jgi:hypothetical protein
MLSVPIRDTEALTGFSAALEALIDRSKLDALAQGLSLTISVSSKGVFPESYASTALRVVDELLCNAIEHGFYKCRRGQILLEITSCAERIYIVAHDDGWGFGRIKTVDGNGFLLLRQIGDVKISHGAHPFKACVGVVVPLVLRTPSAVGRWPQPPPDHDGPPMQPGNDRPPVPRASRSRFDRYEKGGPIDRLHRLLKRVRAVMRMALREPSRAWTAAPARHRSLVDGSRVLIGGGAG